MNNYLIFGCLVLGFSGVGVAAAAPEAEKGDTPKTEKSEDAAADSIGAGSNRNQNDESDREDKRFVPSERISADAPISFPADI